MSEKCKAMCVGCRNDFYNGKNEMGIAECWSYVNATVETRYRLGWWTDPTSPGAHTKVRTLHCHSAPGRYLDETSLPSFAVSAPDHVAPSGGAA